MTTPTKHNRDGLLAISSVFERNCAYILKQCYVSVFVSCSKDVDYFFIVQQLCAFIFNGKYGNTLSFSFDIEFLTHVFMCHRQEKLRSHAAVLTGNAIAITPILYSSGNASLYRSRHEVNANILFSFSTKSSRSTSRYAW